MSLNVALTIAGSDTSGGAGIQADLKTFQELGVFGMSAINVIATMSPENWSHSTFPISLDAFKAQMDTVLSVKIDALKTGMLTSVEVIEIIAKTIDDHQFANVVIDPVMVCKGDDKVLNPHTAGAIRDLLVPRALVVTPNLFEASQLAGTAPIKTVDDMKEAAAKIHELGAKNVIVKGGKGLDHDQAIDVFYDGKEFKLYENEKINTTYVHGAGCTFSAAITAELAKGKSVPEAVDLAKDFVTAAIRHGFQLNQFVGPTMHMAYRKYGTEK